MRDVLPKMTAEEQADSLDEEEVAIVMEIAEVIERVRKDIRNVQFLEMCQRRNY